MEWIDITKQQPRENQNILVWINKRGVRLKCRAAVFSTWISYCDDIETSRGFYFAEIDYELSKHITHWKPLRFKKPIIAPK
ncbi:TPA: DUF551 domain-containing protein [Stenotrophomonas maltophilia]|nr:DUF551 domain-containing protein [Stenotrophomonas maltophilia]